MRYLISSLVLVFSGVSTAGAQGAPDLVPYREIAPVNIPMLVVPTVVEVPLFESQRESGEYLVLDASSGLPVPSYFHEQYAEKPEPVSAYSGPGGYEDYELIDGSRETGTRFEVSSVGENRVGIDLMTSVPVTASRIGFVYGENSTYPVRVEVAAYDVYGMPSIVYREASFSGTEIAFIPTTASRFRIDFVHVQPFDLNEVILREDSVEQSVVRGLRFLAQPGASYRVYRDADRSVFVAYGAQGDLSRDKGVMMLPPPSWTTNYTYRASDTDNDGRADTMDNCMYASNPDQSDIDSNGTGDVCDDYDRDGYMNTNDNCPNIPNYQQDEDRDGIGDECDGVESRLTERLPWVPWVGMGIACLVLVGLFIVVAIDIRKKRPTA